MKQEDWLRDIGKAADDLGYGVTFLEPRQVEIIPVRDQREIRIRIDSIFLNGDLLRELLATRPAPEDDKP